MWLTESDVAALKAGDLVGVTAGNDYEPPSILKVERRTATQVVIGSHKFNKRGREIGGSTWRARWLISVDDAKERRAEFQRQHGLATALRYLREYPWGKLSLEQCSAVKALLATFATSTDAAAVQEPVTTPVKH